MKGGVLTLPDKVVTSDLYTISLEIGRFRRGCYGVRIVGFKEAGAKEANAVMERLNQLGLPKPFELRHLDDGKIALIIEYDALAGVANRESLTKQQVSKAETQLFLEEGKLDEYANLISEVVNTCSRHSFMRS